MEQVVTQFDDDRSAPSADLTPDVPDVDFGSMSPIFTDEHLQNGMYNEYRIDSRYTTETGLDVLAASTENGDCVVVRVHGGITHKHVFWTVERLNAMPLLPKLATKDANEVPIRQELLLCNVLPAEAGGQVWRASGVNVYKLVKAKKGTSKYPVGTTPAELATSSSRYYGPEHFVTSILDSSFAAPGDVEFQQVIDVGV